MELSARGIGLHGKGIGMIHLYTGDGKGKTTAAVGLAVRAAGSGMKVCFSQFMKGNDTGELHSLERLPGVKILRSGKNYGFYSSMSETDKRELTDVHNEILDQLLKAVKSQECRVCILDEVTYPVNWGLLEPEKLKSLLELGKGQTEDSVEIVLTGRSPADFLLECADYITEMKAVRHPYEKGVRARKGIEF